MNNIDFSLYSKKDIDLYIENSFYKNIFFDPFVEAAVKSFFQACINLLIDYTGDKIKDSAGILTLATKKNLLTVSDNCYEGILRPDVKSLKLLIDMANIPNPKVNDENGSELNAVFTNIEKRFLDAGITEMPYCVHMWYTWCMGTDKMRSDILSYIQQLLM